MICTVQSAGCSVCSSDNMHSLPPAPYSGFQIRIVRLNDDGGHSWGENTVKRISYRVRTRTIRHIRMLVGRPSYPHGCTQITLFRTTPCGHVASSGADHIGGSVSGYLHSATRRWPPGSPGYGPNVWSADPNIYIVVARDGRSHLPPTGSSTPGLARDLAMPGWSVDRRGLCQPRTEAGEQACHGEHSESPRTAQRAASLCTSARPCRQRPRRTQIQMIGVVTFARRGVARGRAADRRLRGDDALR
jgi:hypothetical protein